MCYRGMDKSGLDIFLLFFFFFCYFTHLKKIFKCLFLREGGRDRAQTGQGQREGETQNPKQVPGSELSAQNPTRGLN